MSISGITKAQREDTINANFCGMTDAKMARSKTFFQWTMAGPDSTTSTASATQNLQKLVFRT